MGGLIGRGRFNAGTESNGIRQPYVGKANRGMILLFTPPFDKSARDPGYIKGYLPGVRENGGQYTHAAIWTAWAFAKLGQGERAMELFHMLNPISHADTPEKAETLQGGALCDRRRYLQRASAHGPRRLDVVHRLIRLDVPPGPRSHPGYHQSG
jgi:hypothetical protein